jgi:hypothetical protein
MRRSRLAAILSIAVIAVAAGGYGAYWLHFADAVRAGVDRWAAAQRARGYAIDYRELQISGFPGRMRVRAIAAEVGRPAAAPLWRWAGPELVAEVAPWRPQQAVITLPGAQRFELTADGRTRTVTAEAATARIDVELDHRGRVREVVVAGSEIP